MTVVLLFLGWYLSSDGREEGTLPHTDWVHSMVYDHRRIASPSSLEEIVRVVKDANDNNRKLRVLGSGHSWSPIATSNDLYISLINYKGLVAIDTEHSLVTIKGGTTLVEITKMLRERGFALHVLPSVSTQTIAGAIMTATHATGVEHTNIAALVTELEMVLANGTVITVSKETTPDLFEAAVVSVGLLGVVTQVTMVMEKDFNLLEIMTPRSLQHCLDNTQEVFSSAQHVKMWIEWHSETCVVFQVNRTTEAVRDNFNPTVMRFKGHLYEVIQWLVTMVPDVVGRYMMSGLIKSGAVFPHHDRVDRYDGVFNIPFYQAMDHEAELAFPLEDCSSALKTLKRLLDNSGMAVNFITEIRTVKEDNFWMSMNYKQTSCHVTQLLYLPTAGQRLFFFGGFFEETRKLSGRPHWGKEFWTSLKEMKRLYPKMEEFLQLRKDLDPKGTFVNEFLGKLLKLN